MRVLFDAFWWNDGPAANRSVEREFIFTWAKLYPSDTIILAIPGGEDCVEPGDLPKNAKVVGTRLYPHALVNALELSYFARVERVDVVIAHNFAPLFGRSLVYIHDLIFEEHPEWFNWRERRYFSLMSVLARRATAVATSTKSEARRIERLHPALAPVSATGLSVPRSLTSSLPRAVDEVLQFDRFVLSVGRLNVRKNLETVIEGAELSSTVSPNFPLVVVGSAEHSGIQGNLPKSVERLVRSGVVIFLGWIDDAELRWLYENCSAFIFLTRDEGFGMPAFEAMRFGAPVIASDIEVMREVTDGNARYVSPDSSEQVAAAIDEIAPLLTREPSSALSISRACLGDWELAVAQLRSLSTGGDGYGFSV